MTDNYVIRLAAEMMPEKLMPSTPEELAAFARIVAAAEREKVAKWMIEKGYATGHGDTVEDLLKEFEWQIAERMKSEGWRQCAAGQRTTQYCDLLELAVANEREAILKLTDSLGWIDSAAIRARGESK